MSEIPGWPGYHAHANGTITGKTGKVLVSSPHHRTRHLRIRLYGPLGHRAPAKRPNSTFTDFYVHVLVCRVFHGEPPFEGALVRHLDNNPQNNAPENLAWGTRLDNARDYWSDEEAVYRRTERAGIRNPAAYSPCPVYGF